MKKEFLIAVSLIIVIIIFIGLIVYSITKTPPVVYDTPTNHHYYGAQPAPTLSQQEQEKANALSNLTGLLPYKGKDFVLQYSFTKDELYLYINPNQITAGNKELDAFLKKNGVKNRSWITNLQVTSQLITPAP